MGPHHNPGPPRTVSPAAGNALLDASDYVEWHLTSHIGLACCTARQRVAQTLVTLARSVGQEAAGGIALHITNEDLANAANVTPFSFHCKPPD